MLSRSGVNVLLSMYALTSSVRDGDEPYGLPPIVKEMLRSSSVPVVDERSREAIVQDLRDAGMTEDEIAEVMAAMDAPDQGAETQDVEALAQVDEEEIEPEPAPVQTGMPAMPADMPAGLGNLFRQLSEDGAKKQADAHERRRQLRERRKREREDSDN